MPNVFWLKIVGKKPSITAFWKTYAPGRVGSHLFTSRECCIVYCD